MNNGQKERFRVMLLYWGRRGAMTQFAREAALASRRVAELETFISVSRQNEDFATYAELGSMLLPVDTFATYPGAIFQAWRIPFLRYQLSSWLRQFHIDAVIDLMPHIWAPFILPSIRRVGARYVTVAHDADAHPGDRRALLKDLSDRAVFQADRVITLSEAVTRRLTASGRVDEQRITTLFHPDLGRHRPAQPVWTTGAPLRLLFLGRIMPYKGLSLFCEMVEDLQAQGIPVAPGVFGEGQLGSDAKRLKAMGAEVVNRWLTTDEIATILGRYDCLVASHVEASQSGVVAIALGAGLPAIVTPVGGLVEQVEDGTTGLIAERADPTALAEAVKRLILTPHLYPTLRRNIAERTDERSMDRFIRAAIAAAAA